MITLIERNLLRRLANQVAELAICLIEQEKRALWLRHNVLEHKPCLTNGLIRWETP